MYTAAYSGLYSNLYANQKTRFANCISLKRHNSNKFAKLVFAFALLSTAMYKWMLKFKCKCDVCLNSISFSVSKLVLFCRIEKRNSNPLVCDCHLSAKNKYIKRLFNLDCVFTVNEIDVSVKRSGQEFEGTSRVFRRK